MTPSSTPVEFNSLTGALSGDNKRGLVLISHGAGGTMDNALLVQTADKLNELGFLTLRWNFGYVAARRAPSAAGKREIPEMACAVDFLLTQQQGTPKSSPLILIGKSFGGRLATYLGQTRTDIAGYVFYGLPLKGAGKNARERDWSHLSKLGGRAIFITGERDKLCPLDQLVEAQKNLVIPYESQIVSGDHSFKPRGEQPALERCVKWIGDNF